MTPPRRATSLWPAGRRRRIMRTKAEGVSEMGLTCRDAVASLLVVVALAATAAVVFGWNWMLLGDARAASVALLVLSYPSCLVALAPQQMAEAMRQGPPWNRYLVWATVFGALATVLIGANLLANSVPLLVGAAVCVVGVWLVTTAHHALEPGRPALRTLSAT